METQTCMFIGNHPFMLNGKHTVCLFIRNYPFMLNGKYTECLFIENSYVMFHGKQRHHVKIKKNPTEPPSLSNQIRCCEKIYQQDTVYKTLSAHCQPNPNPILTLSAKNNNNFHKARNCFGEFLSLSFT